MNEKNNVCVARMRRGDVTLTLTTLHVNTPFIYQPW